MSDDFESFDSDFGAKALTLDALVDEGMRKRARNFVNSREERRIRDLAEAQEVDYGFAHSLVKSLYGSVHRSSRKEMPHQYPENADTIVGALTPGFNASRIEALYCDAKRNGLIATFDEHLGYGFPLGGMDFSGLDVYGRANRKIIALFDDAVSVVDPTLKPFQVASHSKVLSRVGSYFSPNKDSESLFLLYTHAKSRNARFVDE